MKIIFDYQIFGNQRYGGISRYFYEISRLIPSINGDEVEIFAPFYVNEYLRKAVEPRLIGVKLPGRNFPAFATKLANVTLTRLRSYFGGGDIFHETYYSKRDLAPRSAKRVLTVHDMIHEKFPASFDPNSQISRDKRKSIMRADHLICVSENTRRDLIAATGLPIERTTVIHHGFALAESSQQAARLPSKPYLLYVGGRNTYKNFARLLEAYSRAELQRELSLVCFGNSRFTANEISLIRSFRIRPGSVIFISGDDNMLASLYASASAFVYPSLYEGFGIPLLEAMSFGCPVICSNTSSMPEVAGDAAEFFDPYNVDSMISSLERVLSSQERSRQLVARGFERIKFFSWERCAKETLAVYGRTLME